MAKIKPFRAVRPSKDKVHLVVTRSVDMYKKDVMDIRMRTNPYSFLHVLLPDFFKEDKTKPNSPERFTAVRNALDTFLKEEILVQDSEESFYVYRQKSIYGTITGLIALSSCEDYRNGTIKKHEDTITIRENLLKDYLDVVKVNSEPVCFTYPDDYDLDNTIHGVCMNEPLFDFTTVDRNRHSLWRISDINLIDRITRGFDKISHYYIADGHHRSAASNLYSEISKDNNPNHTGKEAYNFFMGVFFSESQLRIFEYNRLINDLNGNTVESLLSQIKMSFDVSPLAKLTRPKEIHHIHMYVEGKWFLIKANSNLYVENNPVSQLDAEILSKYILDPILGIKDLKNDRRVSFQPGTHDISELVESVDKGISKIAFVLHPLTKDQLKDVSNAHKTMPPKTTWIEPKMRSGMTIYHL